MFKAFLSTSFYISQYLAISAYFDQYHSILDNMGVILNRIQLQFTRCTYCTSHQCYQHPTIFKLFCDQDSYTLKWVIEELLLQKMSTNISGHPRIYRDIRYCICNSHHLTIFCNLEVYLAIVTSIRFAQYWLSIFDNIRKYWQYFVILFSIIIIQPWRIPNYL